MLPLALALALASAPSSKWVALVHTSGDVPASWRQSLQEAAEANKQSSQWAPPPAVTLDEAQLALGCAGWSKACAGQIAAMTGAAVALVVDVTAKDAGASVTVQAVKTNGAGMGPEEKLELTSRTDKDLEFAKDFVKNAKGQRQGYLLVDSDTPGAEVSVDGEKKGKLPWKDLLPAGEHKVQVTAEGKAPYTKTVTVKAGVLSSEVLALSAAGPPVEITPSVGEHVVETAPPPQPSAPAKSDNSVVGWSLAGGGGAVAAVGTVLASATIYDRFYNRVSCGSPVTACVPNRPLLFGLYPAGKDREKFGSDASAWIGGSVAAVGVGALLIGTGVVLATGEAPAETASTPPASTSTAPGDKPAPAPPAIEGASASPTR